MRVLQRGHRYELMHRGGTGTTVIQYVNKEPGHEQEGILQQELLRVMIDRNRYCNNCLPHPNNERIQYHLRMALALHEGRAIERKVQKGELEIEHVRTTYDGHFYLHEDGNTGALSTLELDPVPSPAGEPKHNCGD